ncbi:MAG: hypothetical protein QOG17_3263, partial [Gammaproteobacteria bacterium]|nr:hypothetical protein [Gammaproteobacteria bacterium]
PRNVGTSGITGSYMCESTTVLVAWGDLVGQDQNPNAEHSKREPGP